MDIDLVKNACTDGACLACPRKCGARRSHQRGFCGASDKVSISRISLHRWEEPPISAQNGSGTIFFTGCNLRCVFCQNRTISSGADAFEGALELTEDELYDAMLRLEAAGAHNINLVTPTHYVPMLAEVLKSAKKRLSIPIVYNSSGYDSVDSLRLLQGLVDVYLPDLKYFSSELSSKYSKAPDYFEVASAALCEMLRQVGEVRFEGDLIKKGMIVRHLVLPSCRADSIALLDELARLLPIKRIRLSLMRQFTPDFVDGEMYPELCRRLTSFEYSSVVKKAESLGFEGYIQGADSACSDYTPSFNCPEAFTT